MRVICLLFFLINVCHANNDLYPYSSAEDAKRFHLLIQTIRCVVCQNQSIADSNAPLANDLRMKIYHMVAEKKSDTDIQTYLEKRYGEFILFKPKFEPITWVLWLFPVGGLLIVVYLLIRYLRRLC